ncbi:T9SS type A sorting domain-containing protein [Cytophaga hutchinsonii]|uniref:Secretion system C-terminal sorting domain-containing protein n=1 Tax=Cytophaga hutchinsonii (strain ATCC 33406 / DSM 1761 / CIP 103989 / NBRC 15051 / NCIMB 9469 / D465) TaxID=269798 RepID=A0A6N4SNA1_CYTH3|nr:T9SS type A sorting domain-containing protein [Cytophaga hutchinsonii]ABG57769.1 conserved hypothetical protein [Cytophaga hutchinsonii ATCC 33406]SFX05031.1 Por secretion system C-terminal sorting domain-containing protein [Cytophaga hutchinsonii ATCC 33406]
MKKILLTSALVATSLFSFAQTPAVPNGGFENWSEALCDGETPDEYVTTADMFFEDNGVCPTTTGISKSTTKYSGTYALQLTSATQSGINIGNSVFLSSDFTGRPTKLVGYTKFTKGGTDTLGIMVAVGDIENENPVAYGELTLSATQGAYTKFEITLEYDAENTSDVNTLVLVIGTGAKTGFASSSTVALIDALSFEYSPTSTVNYAAKSPINVFAANNTINFSENVSDVHVVDMVGASKIQEASSTKTMNTSSLTSGLYIVTYNYNGNYFSKKVVIE